MRLRTGIFGLLAVLSLATLCPFSSAYADVAPVENDGAINFVYELSTESTIPDFDLVAVLANANSIYTGVNWVNEDGSIALKNQLSQNLVSYKHNVLFGSTWDELPSEQQTQWGSSDNYYAANFNSSLDAIGLGDARDRYYSTGGGSFEFSSDEIDVLDQLKGLYDDWNTGKDVLVSDILGLYDSNAKDDLSAYLGVQSYRQLDTSNLNGYVARMPNPLIVMYGTRFSYNVISSNSEHDYSYWTNTPVYCVVYYYSSTSARYVLCSKTTFKYMTGRYNANYEITRNPTHVTGEYDYYYAGAGESVGTFVSSNGGFALSGETTYNNVEELARVILFNEQIDGIGSVQPDIDNYPEDISQSADVGIYFPTSGITQDTSWTQYIEQIAEDTDDIVTLLKRILTEVKLLDSTSEDLTDLENLVSRFQFYASGQLKVHDEGVFDSLTDIGNDINDILQQLIAWPKGDAVDAPELIGDFDFPELKLKAGDLTETISELAPFGGLLLLSEMVGILSQTGNIQNPDFHVPFKFMPGQNLEVVIDLSWLDDGRVYINFFCIMSLILCLLNVTIRIIELEAAT